MAAIPGTAPRRAPGPSEAKSAENCARLEGSPAPHALHPPWDTQRGVPGGARGSAAIPGRKFGSGGGSAKLQWLGVKLLGLHTRVAEAVTAKSERGREGEERAGVEIGSDSGTFSELLW